MLRGPGAEGGGHGMASASDCANCFAARDSRCELGAQCKILDKACGAKCEDDAAVRGRLRADWEVAEAEKSRNSGLATSLRPAMTCFSFASDQMPMRPLVCRVAREFKSSDQRVSLMDAKRIRSEAQLKPA
ncbi:unnamed protein product, partial [Prorocentrum cordatum]